MAVKTQPQSRTRVKYANRHANRHNEEVDHHHNEEVDHHHNEEVDHHHDKEVDHHDEEVRKKLVFQKHWRHSDLCLFPNTKHRQEKV